MKPVIAFSLLMLLFNSCKEKDNIIEDRSNERLEMIRYYFGIDGLIYQYYYYDSNGRISGMMQKDVTVGSPPGPNFFRSFERNSQGLITKMTSLSAESRPDTLISVVTYLAGTSKIDHVISTARSIRDSGKYVYSGSLIYVDKHSWNTSTLQYSFVNRTTYELQNGNFQSIKRVQPGSLYNTWTRTYTYDDMRFPLTFIAEELILADWKLSFSDWYEGQLLNNKATTIFSYTDIAGNMRSKKELFIHTYRDDKRPLKTSVMYGKRPWGWIDYIYK